MEEYYTKNRMLTKTMVLWYEAQCLITLLDCAQNGKPTLEKVTVNTINLSEYVNFDFYNPVWYCDTLIGEKGEALPGRWISISHIVGAGMCYWVLNEQWNVISRSTTQHVTKEDILNPTLKETLKLADNKIKDKLADKKHEIESCQEKKFFHQDILLE